MMYRLFILWVALAASAYSAQAFAQAAPTAKDLCAKVFEGGRADCEKKLGEFEAALAPEQWKQFAACVATKDITQNGGEDTVTCLSGEMLKRIMEVSKAKADGKPIPPYTPSTPTVSKYVPPAAPANGTFFSPEEVCGSATAEKKPLCITELTQMKDAFGDAMWTTFSACAITKDFSIGDGKDAIACIDGAMIQILMKKAEEQSKTPPTPHQPTPTPTPTPAPK